MKDFPVFTTEYGVASLVLKEVPYRQEAYIIMRSALQPRELLAECVSFCAMVGAEKIFARGHEVTEEYPLHVIIYDMRGEIETDELLVENLWPVTAETVGKWRELVNEKMRDVDNSGTLEKNDEKEILETGGAYFVHRDGKLLGAGWIADGEMKVVVAAEQGMGSRVFHTLLSVSNPQRLYLQVASTNGRAIRFYEKMGMIKTSECSRWYRVL